MINRAEESVDILKRLLELAKDLLEAEKLMMKVELVKSKYLTLVKVH